MIESRAGRFEVWDSRALPRVRPREAGDEVANPRLRAYTRACTRSGTRSLGDSAYR